MILRKRQLRVIGIVLAFGAVVFTGCSPSKPRNSIQVLGLVQETGAWKAAAQPDPDALALEFTPNIVGLPPPVPPGAVEYCWEEPMVRSEANGPGVDIDGRYYEPAYIAVRQVRAGRWRPCSPANAN